MNHLAHLYLAERSGTSFAGNFLGDFVRGRLAGQFDPEIESGIRMHRRIDSFSDAHALVAEARGWFSPPYRRYAGILLDVYFDHLLIRRWHEFHDEPVDHFILRAVATMRREWPQQAPFPAERLAGLADVLRSYRRLQGIDAALCRADARLARRSPLPDALPLLTARHEALDRTFAAFFPTVLEFSLAESRAHGRGPERPAQGL